MLKTFRPRLAAAAFAICLAGPLSAPAGAVCYFGECGPGTAASAAPAASGSRVSIAPTAAPEQHALTLQTHGSWSAVAGENGIMFIVDEFNDGSKFAIVDADEKVGVMMTNRSWHLVPGQKFKMKIIVDGKVFSSIVPATDETTIGIEDVESNFISAFYNGQKARIEIGQYSADILSLPDAASAIDDAILFKKASMR